MVDISKIVSQGFSVDHDFALARLDEDFSLAGFSFSIAHHNFIEKWFLSLDLF